MKVAVISASLGGIDPRKVHTQQKLKPGVEVEFFHYDDSNTILRSKSMKPRLQAKIYRMRMAEMHPGFDYYIWLDGSFTITSKDFISFMVDSIGTKDAAFFKHPQRKTIQEEAEFVLDGISKGSVYLSERYAGESLAQEVEHYLSQPGFEDKVLTANGCFIIRDTKKIDEMMKDWLYAQIRWSQMDQISLPAKLFKFKIKYNIIDLNICLNDYIHHTEHPRTHQVNPIQTPHKELHQAIDNRPVVDVVMLTATKTRVLQEMTQNSIDTLHASERNTRFNIILIESWNLPVESGPSVLKNDGLGFKEIRSKVKVDDKGWYEYQGNKYRGPEGSNGNEVAILERFNEVEANWNGYSLLVSPKKAPLTKKDLEGYKNCTVVKCNEKFNYNKFLMIGLEHGTAEDVILCNNDLLFKPGWYSLLREKMKKHKLASASPRCPRWAMQTALVGKGKVLMGWRTSLELSGWCICTTRKTIKKIGGLDYRQPYYGSDNAYGIALYRKQLKHALVVDSIVEHLFSTTTRAVPERKELYGDACEFLHKNYPEWPIKNEPVVLE